MSALTNPSTDNTHEAQFLAPETGQQAGEDGVGEVNSDAQQTYSLTATYSPDDNKLRFTSAQRLDKATYGRVKAAGFCWAPKQQQFIAPMWTPERADLCIELAGQIDDDDGSLQARAEDRAERFDGYSSKRGAESARALDHVHQITAGIPLGQPIMVGHHSQRHAERDAKRIESGMRRAVDLFDTAEYWKRRAAAALARADYKERADVRHRRIKGLESDRRKFQKAVDDSAALSRIWEKVPRAEWDGQTALALAIAGRFGGSPRGTYDALRAGTMHGDAAWRLAVDCLATNRARPARWLQHIGNRIAYERAMLDEAGGLAADRFDIQIGGLVLIGREWFPVLRINKSGGQVVSVTVKGRYVPVRGIEEVQDYRPPTEEAAEAAAKVTKQAPLTNYAGPGFVHITRAQWDEISKDYKGTRDMGAGVDATRGGLQHDSVKDYRAGSEAFARHRVRVAMGTSLRHALGVDGWAQFMAGMADGTDRANRSHGLHPVFITDAKTTPAAKVAELPMAKQPSAAAVLRAEVDRAGAPPAPLATPSQSPATHSDAAPLQRAEVDAVRAALKAGVTAVATPQLFPTPPDLAARMVELADVQRCDRVLEPSAGTGRLLEALEAVHPLDVITVKAIEVNPGLAASLRQRAKCVNVYNRDFLACGAELGQFERIIMNPPFAGGADVEHVTHAAGFMAPGGRLVAVMSAGVTFRQDRKTTAFRALVSQMGGTIEELPAGTFESSGTGVNTVLVVLDAPAEKVAPEPSDLPGDFAEGVGAAVADVGPRSHFEASGRMFKVCAEFPDNEDGTYQANEYMERNDGTGVLAVEGGRIIVAHCDDDGTGKVVLPELEAPRDYTGPDGLQAQAREIAWNVTLKRVAWSAHGVPTAAELRGAAARLEEIAGTMDEPGGRLAQAYRAAAQIVRGHAAAAGTDTDQGANYMRSLGAVYLPNGDEAPRGWSGVAHDGESAGGGLVVVDGRNVTPVVPV